MGPSGVCRVTPRGAAATLRSESEPTKGPNLQRNRTDKGPEMAYMSIDDLPDFLRQTLPLHAQEIYRAAYNRGVGCPGSPQGQHPDTDTTTRGQDAVRSGTAVTEQGAGR